MSRPAERTLLALDNTGPYWIIHRYRDNAASILVVNKTGPNVNVEELLGTQCDILHSEILQELDARRFEGAWYIKDFEVFKTACDIARDHRLRWDQEDSDKADWIVADIEVASTILNTKSLLKSSKKLASMSKRPRDDQDDLSLWSERHQLDKNAPALGRGDTYRPNYDDRRPSVLSSAKTKQSAEYSATRRPSISPGQDLHNGVNTSKYDGRLDKARRPMQQLRQMNSVAGVFPPRPHEVSSAAPKRPSGDHESTHHAGSVGQKKDFPGVPRGPKLQSRPRPPQAPAAQRILYDKAVEDKIPDVIPHEDLARLKERPHIFISSSYLPFVPATIPHLRKFCSKKDIHNVSVKAEANGYYLFFPDDVFGRKDLQQCYERANDSTLFGEYTLHMELRTDGEVSSKRLSINDENGVQKLGESLEGFESRFKSLPLPFDGLSASHLRTKADDEISIPPSEISSATTRARSYCAECKGSHFASYDPACDCKTCPRRYHARCRKPQPRLSEDKAPWQCNYCIKKGRTISNPAQQKVQTKNSGQTIFRPVSPQNGTRKVGSQPTGQIRMGASARNFDEAAQATQSGAREAYTGRSSSWQGIISDPRLRNRPGGTNGFAAPPEAHKHSSGTHPTKEHDGNINTSRATEPTRNMQSHADTLVDLEELNTKQYLTANAEAAIPMSGSHVGVPVSQASASEKTRTTIASSEGDANRAAPWDINQADLSPEIPDLSLDIDEASLGEKTEIRGYQTVPVASNGSHELAKCGPEVPGSPPEKKLSSRPRCSMCGKPLFSALGKAADATCARCKKEQVGREDGSVVSRSAGTAEEIWRLRLQREKAHENGLAAPTNPTPQPHHEPSLGKQPPKKPTAEIGKQPERADRSPSSQSETEDQHGSQETSSESEGRMAKMISAATVEEEGDVEVTHGEEAAETRRLTPSRGPSVEANELERRPGSPVNKNINNDDAAGMESDNALSDTRLSRSSAGSGVRPNVGRKVANAAEPPVKLPGSFSWPDLIGFALAEARDHRMTAAQVHQWIADNVENYSVHNTTQRSSIAATLSQQKVKFPKTEPITEGSRQLSRWMLAPDWVPNFRQGLDDVRESLSKTSSQPGLSQRRKELNDAPKPARGAPSTSAAKPAPPLKESSKTSMHTEDPPMFIKRHRVAYDADGRDIVAGFKDIPIEKWTQLAEVESFRKHGLRLFVGDYIKAPLPNRFRFADYTHKPLVQTIAQIEEIRQRRDGPGYAVLVQWFLTKEAAEWWKCRLVKSLWPKDEKAGVYVPATIWDILTSEFVAEQEKLDAEEAKRQIVPNLFFDLDTDKLRLYLKEGRGPKIGIAFGPRASDESNGAGDTACGLNRPEERFSGLSRHIEHLPKRPKVPVETSEASEQTSPPKPLSPSNHVSPRKTGPSALAEEQPTESSPRTSPVQTEQDSVEQDSTEHDSTEQDSAEQDSAETLDLERQLFTPSPAHGLAVETADIPGPASATLSAPTPTTERSAKRQKTGVTPEEQEAIRAFIRKEQENAKYESKSLWAAAPDYDPANELWDREAKIAEIKARPSRKARFGQNLAYARLDRSPNALYIEVERPLPKTYKAPPSDRPGSGYSNSSRGGGKAGSRADSARSNLDAADYYYMRRPNSEQQPNDDTDMPDAPQTQASSTDETGREGWVTPSNDEADMMEERPETFETLEELLGLPTNFVPTIYEGRLAFRDGTVGLDGRRPRAKKIFKVGRNVPGELK